ncbi:hypothetical protein GJAV_G00192670 [Gymnothorax javanicus]|nr:hypothetical protein GJAV_G00192670 [Gymnothorax javanicus]
MDSKEEISDTDSGIILQSGPDSPTSPIKDLTTHTRAMKLKHKALEERLELCLLELKQLCIREAELTGELSSDYPLLPGEKLPRIRRRIGAAFKLNEDSIWQDRGDPELNSLEAELALQLQIYEAARRLALEEPLSKQVRRSRQQQSKREERKVKELQEAVLKLKLRDGQGSPHLEHTSSLRDAGISDDSSLSDAVALDEDVESSQSSLPTSENALTSNFQNPSETDLQPLQSSPQHGAPEKLEGVRSGEDRGFGLERSPIQNSPWKESSLDQPYQKPRKPRSACSSRSSSPAVTPVSTPLEPRLGDTPIPFPLASVKGLPLHHAHSSSAPTTPELHTRRQYSQSFRLPNHRSSHDPSQSRGRAQLPRRRLTDFTATSPQYSPLRPGQANPMFQSSAEDSSSEHSLPSYAGSPGREAPVKASKPCPPPYSYHLAKHGKHSSAHHTGPLAFSGPSFYRISQHQSTPSFYRVSEELKSWHQRNQVRVGPRPRSLDRQGAVRLRNMSGRDSPLSLQHHRPQQFPHRRILQRAPDGTPVRWYVEEDSEISFGGVRNLKLLWNEDTSSTSRDFVNCWLSLGRV